MLLLLFVEGENITQVVVSVVDIGNIASLGWRRVLYRLVFVLGIVVLLVSQLCFY